MLISVKIIKDWLWSKFLKISILDKIYKNLEFGHNFRKISILVKIVRNSRFLVKTFQNVDFGQNCKKCWL